MKAKVFINQKAVNLVAAVGMLLAMLLPAAFPMLASAATLDSRSVALSSSAADDASVSYDLTFTPASDFKAVIIDFCKDSPIPGQACSVSTALTGFDASSATVTVGNTLGIGTLTPTVSTASVKLVGSGTNSTHGTPVHVALAGIHNPTAVGAFYARVYTYNTTSPGWTGPTVIGSPADTGGIALDTTSAIGVSAAVRETLTFCVAGDHGTLGAGTNYITTDCGDAASHAPNITLGHGTPAALDAGATDTADVYTQVSTNALSGVAVYMKNSNTCGGLSRDGGTTCDIAPANTPGTLGAGVAALFGMKVDAPSGGSGTITGEAEYTTSSDYGMSWVSGGASGVTSPYGDKIYHSTTPVNNVNVPLTYGATVTNTTPAGLYKANMNLVATGTF